MLKRHNITPKQYFLLKEYSDADVTAEELAKTMCLSTITVHQHLSALRKRLHVKTTVGLVVKAHRLGIINLDEE